LVLANTKSAQKRIRQNSKHRDLNRVHRGRARTAVKQARIALDAGEVEEAREAVRAATKWLDQAASKGVIHGNNAARRKSRLMKQLAALEAEAK
jgi:small subunit ribosomal protein S20